VHTVNVIQPADVFNLKFRSRNATDEALAFDLFFDFTFDGSFFSERVNDDTEENVHEDDVEQHEEEEVVEVPCIVVGVTKGCIV
jgi:predicted DsbA family dithiol-disulfide isomerase